VIPAGRFLTSRNAPGLDAEYFLGENFETLGFKRVDQQINFDWSAKSPFEQTAVTTAKTTRLQLSLPQGSYTARWVNTRTGAFDKTDRFRVGSSQTETLTSPSYVQDIALEIRRNERSPFKTILDISPVK
jgi:hypothetical protein